jgi:uncharacterized protein (DUF3820 family)
MLLDRKFLIDLAHAKMPFGKYKGRYLIICIVKLNELGFFLVKKSNFSAIKKSNFLT